VPRQRRQLEDNDIPVNCGGELGIPLITPCKDSLKLEVHTDYTLRCEASEPIVWWHSHDGLRISEVFNNIEDPGRPHGIKLNLESVTVDNVGAYYCIKSSMMPIEDTWSEETLTELVNNDNASTIYVYVNDQQNLLVPLEPIINARQYTEVTIPCKPSMPETEVLLTFNSEVSTSGHPRSFVSLSQSHTFQHFRYDDFLF